MTRKLTPPPELAAYIAAHRAHVSYDGRAEDVDAAVRLSPEQSLPPGTYRVNADGTLTLLDD